MALAPHKRKADYVFSRAAGAGAQYVTTVNTGRLNAEMHTDYLNHAFAQGYALHSIFEQHRNTVMVFERRG
jgi:hypothetical protein